MHEPRRAATIFVFVTVLLDMMAFGMIIPVLPHLIQDFMGGDAAAAARVNGYFGTSWALMQLIFMPILGSLSDRLGRRPVILLSVTGLGLDFILMALAPSLSWLFVGRIISGITAANMSTTSAYIADVTPPDKRAGAYGLMGAAFGIGFILGPAVGGLLGNLGPRVPFWVAAGCCLANALYGLFVLPESLPADRRTPFSLQRANPVGALSFLRQQPGLLRLTGLKFAMDLSHTVMPATFVLATSYRFGWTQKDTGLVLGVIGLCSMIVQAGLIRPVVARLGERRALPLGLAFGIAGSLIYGLADDPTTFLIGVPIAAFGGLAGPSLQALLTRKVSPAEQGRLQGALASVQGLAGLIGPTVGTQAFAWFIRSDATVHLPGVPFLIGAALLSVALTGSLWATDTAATG